jgi:hypothetical protein
MTEITYPPARVSPARHRRSVAGEVRPHWRKSAKGRNMARALLGHLPTTADRHLIEENARLRSRIHQLEAELTALKDSISSDQLLDELHRITSSASALA